MIKNIEQHAAELLLKWEGGHISPLEVIAFAKSLQDLAKDILEQEALKKAAYNEALLYGKEGRTIGGYKITAMQSVTYKNPNMPEALKQYISEAAATAKAYEDAAKKLATLPGAEASIMIPATGEQVAVAPAIKLVTDTVKCSQV